MDTDSGVVRAWGRRWGWAGGVDGVNEGLKESLGCVTLMEHEENEEWRTVFDNMR